MRLVRQSKRLRDNRDLLTELRHNSVIASESINWENESSKVEELYSSIINKHKVLYVVLCEFSGALSVTKMNKSFHNLSRFSGE